MSFVTRFAPSPTGRLHRGHAFSALTAFDAASRAGGRFLLRLEDIDSVRCRREFADAIFEDLAWLGLTWEQPVRRQSEHMAEYRAALAKLQSLGALYMCRRTRREVLEAIGRAPHGGEDHLLPSLNGEGGFERLREGGWGTLKPASGRQAAAFPTLPLSAAVPPQKGRDEEFAWRLDARTAVARVSQGLSVVERDVGAVPLRPELIDDVVLGRKDVGVAYHLAVVVDDALQGVTEVIRGDDLAPAAHVQRLLQALLGLPPVVYRHHPLLLRPDGKRFAKRDTAETLGDLRARGVTPSDLRRELGLAVA